MTRFSSADFWRVGSKISPTSAASLLHKQVCGGGQSQGSQNFSAERSHKVDIVDLPSHTISMTIGHLAPNQRTRRHRHNYETIIYVLSGRGKTVIDDVEIEWSSGDALYIPCWSYHHHVNVNSEADACYIACENAPLLQNLGQIAVREELDGDANVGQA
jgi:pyrroloquinoline-quinone synthase